MENFVLNLFANISFQMPQSESHGNGSGQGVRQTEILLSEKQRVPRGGQEAWPGQQDLLALPSSPVPGLAGTFSNV